MRDGTEKNWRRNKNETLMCLFPHQWRNTTAAVHVTKTEEPEKTTIRLDSESGKICVGETVTVVAIVTPEGTPVEWSSSDKTVATVEDGVITGVGEGSIKITARADTAQAVHRIRRKQPF